MKKNIIIAIVLIAFAALNFVFIYFGAIHSIKTSNNCSTLPIQCEAAHK